MVSKILDKVDVEVVYPGGREVRGYARFYPEATKQVLFQVFDYNGNDSYIVNLQLAESIKLVPTFKE
jgi:predicted metallopeptidase